MRVALTVAVLFVLGASPALLLEMRRPPAPPETAPPPSVAAHGPWAIKVITRWPGLPEDAACVDVDSNKVPCDDADVVVRTCSVDGRMWFHARADGACHAEDAPK